MSATAIAEYVAASLARDAAPTFESLRDLCLRGGATPEDATSHAENARASYEVAARLWARDILAPSLLGHAIH